MTPGINTWSTRKKSCNTCYGGVI